MPQNPEINFLQRLPKQTQQEFRKAVITMILATDMSVHFDFLDRFNKRFATCTEEEQKKPLTDEEQTFALAMLVHCADISNPAKPKDTYLDWTDRVLAEFYNQGAKEASNGLPVSTFYEKANPSVGKMQTGFIKFIVRPIFTAWCEFVPQLKDMTMPHIEANAALWTPEEPLIPPDQPFTIANKVDWDWESGCWRTQ